MEEDAELVEISPLEALLLFGTPPLVLTTPFVGNELPSLVDLMTSPSLSVPLVWEADAELVEISPLDALLLFRTPLLMLMTPSGTNELPSLVDLMESPTLSVPVLKEDDAELVEISPLDELLLFQPTPLMLMTPSGPNELCSWKELIKSPSLPVPVVKEEDAELVEISPLDALLLFGTPPLLLMTPSARYEVPSLKDLMKSPSLSEIYQLLDAIVNYNI